jgi:hypothetical protein
MPFSHSSLTPAVDEDHRRVIDVQRSIAIVVRHVYGDNDHERASCVLAHGKRLVLGDDDILSITAKSFSESRAWFRAS